MDMAIDFQREVIYEEISAEWKKDLTVIGVVEVKELYKKYLGIETSYKHISNMEYGQVAKVRYSLEEQTAVIVIDNLPSIKNYTVVEIKNVVDETDAFHKVMGFMVLILIELAKITPMYTVEQLLQNRKELLEWKSNYEVVN